MKNLNITTIHVYITKLWLLLLTSKIFRRFLLASLVVSLIPLIIFTWITLKHSKAEIYKQSLIQLQITANGAESQILEYLNYLKNKTAVFALDKFIAENVGKYRQSFLYDQAVEDLNYYLLHNKLSTFPECLETFILDPDGRVIASSTISNIGMDYSKTNFFLNGQKSPYMSDIFCETGIEQFAWFVSAPLTGNKSGKLIGILVNRIDPKSLSDITTGRKAHTLGAMSQPTRKGKTGETYIVNHDKLMITESRFLDDAVLKQVVDTDIVRLTMKQGQTILANYQDYRGIPVFGASILIKEMGWIIITEVDFEEAFIPVHKLQTIILLGIAMLIPVILFITWMLSLKFTRPIMRLIQADNAVIKGDQTLAIIPNHEIPSNELGDVMRSRNEMLANLKEMKMLIQSQERYRLLVENIPDIVWITDREGNTSFISPQVEKIYGYTQNEIYETNNSLWFGRIHHDDVERVKKSYESLFTSNKAFNIEYRLRRKDGIWIWVHDRAIRTDEKDGVLCAEGLLTDITEHKLVEQRRNILYATTRILAESDTVEKAISKILQVICENLEWEVSAFWITDKENTVLRCVKIWHSPSVNVPEFEALSRKIVFKPGIGLPGRIYASSKPAWITDVVCDPNFPRSPIAVKEGLHGAFGFPVLIGSEILGVLEFFSHDIQPPSEDLLKVMASLGGQIGQFIMRKDAEEELCHRTEFEKTVANISSRFVILSDFDKAVSLSLVDAGKLSRASRAYLFQFRDTGNIIDNTHEWCAERVTPEIQHLQNIPSNTFPWLMANLRAGKVVHIGDVSKMPLEAIAEKTEFERQSIKSLLILPVYVEKNLLGFVGFDNVKSTGPWSEEDIALLRIMAEIIGNAMARIQSEKLISHMAYHDALTKLPNRNLLQDRLKLAIAHASRSKKFLAIMMLDLDGFKTVNDTIGHKIGDLLLNAVAERLTHCVREEDTVARMGGDEFVVVLPDITQAQDASVVAQKIMDALRRPFQIENHELHITASIGISIFPLNSNDTEGLLRQADAAMYLSKKGKNNYHFYKSNMDTHT
ncbi:MAG: diguanylate cyclase [Planctomycetes bacterium]|nr:diguanylate cyclase [Planctomycetota bacterium]